GLLAPNSTAWVALDLALTAEGVIVVPLYPRQAPGEIVNMLKDCGAAMVCCGDEALCDSLEKNWPGALAPLILFDEVFATEASNGAGDDPVTLGDSDRVQIFYTPATAGEPKGVMPTADNVTFMLGCTGMRLDQLMDGATETTPDQVFHYLPCCFAGSWILALSCLSRNSLLTLSTDLTKLADELKLAAPQYFLNVPTLLERIRRAVENPLPHH